MSVMHAEGDCIIDLVCVSRLVPKDSDQCNIVHFISTLSHSNFQFPFSRQGARVPWHASWPTNTARQGGENVHALTL